MNFKKSEACLLLGARHLCAGIMSATLFASGVFAQETGASLETPTASGSVGMRYPAGSIRSVEAAELALAAASKERNEVEQRFVAEKRTCYAKFFAAACMDDAKEQRRQALAQLRAVEIEANAFKRQAHALERDQISAEKRAREEKDRLERVGRQQEHSSAPRPEDGEPKDHAFDTTPAVTTPSERKARHEAKLRRLRADEAADAKRRADNVAAYEKKVQAAQAHQKEVQDKKAEKERERAMRQSSLPQSH